MNELIKNKTVIIISTIEWNMQRQVHHQVAYWLSKHVKKVIFLENLPKRSLKIGGVKRIIKRFKNIGQKNIKDRRHKSLISEADNIDIIAPFALPSSNKFFCWINLEICLKILSGFLRKRLTEKNPIVWCYLPTRSSLDLINLIKPSLLVYHCVSNFIDDPYSPKDIGIVERELLNRADTVICDSDFLYSEKRKIRKDVIQILPSVNYNLFKKTNTGMIKNPIKRVCYFGGINKVNINFNILKSIALAGFELWIVGPVRSKLPKLPSNVKFFGMVEHEELPQYIRKCDCLILPYNVNEFTKGVIPAKFFECFATGKPIISTPIPNFMPYKDIIIIKSTPEEFVQAIKNIEQFENEEKYNRRIEIAKNNSEEKQFDRLLKIIECKIKEEIKT